jgi:hypothetical protein
MLPVFTLRCITAKNIMIKVQEMATNCNDPLYQLHMFGAKVSLPCFAVSERVELHSSPCILGSSIVLGAKNSNDCQSEAGCQPEADAGIKHLISTTCWIYHDMFDRFFDFRENSTQVLP